MVNEGVEYDLLKAVKECKTFVEMLCSKRNDDTVWNDLYQTALNITEPFDIVVSERQSTSKQNI